jgi:hypothetical protein
VIVAYLDTNVFNDLVGKRSGTTDTDVSALHDAVSGRRVSIPLSSQVLSEKLFTAKESPDTFRRDIDFIYGLVDQNTFWRDPAEFLKEHLHCYARGLPLTDYWEMDGGNAARGFLNMIQSDDADIDELIAEITARQRKSLEWMRNTTQDVRKKAEALVDRDSSLKKELAAVCFEDTWRANAERFACGLAEHAGVLDACRQKGIDGLLTIKSIRLCVSMYLSLFYDHDFEGRSPKKGDYGDILHALFGAGADVFVTNDCRFREVLSRVPVDDFAVMDLPTFVQRIG